MLKSRFFTLLICLFSTIGLIGQQNSSVQVISSIGGETVLHFTLGETQFKPVNTPKGRAFIVTAKDAVPILKSGAPDLQKITASIVIPDRGQTSIEIISSTTETQTNIEVAPSKGNLVRTVNPSDVPYTYGTIYTQNAFFPAVQAELHSPYIARDFRGQTVAFYPFRYNPVTRDLIICKEITIKVKTILQSQGINEFIRSNYTLTPEFKQVYHRQFVNFAQIASVLYNPVGEQGEMLIIAPSGYMSTLQPFVDWKNQCGIQTTVVDVATIGNTAVAIKTYIANFYANHSLAFVLLAGDAAQVSPSQTTAGPSDNDYSYIVGSDHYPDCFVGRFSAETTAELDIMINRSISYEKNPAINTQYATCLGIGSNEGPGDDGEMDYEHQQNIGARLLTYTYSTFYEAHDGSQGGNDAAGDPTASDISNVINNGVGLINYTGHGSSSSFSTSGFSSWEVDALTNTQVWPFIISVACVNGDFVNNTCFAEHWIRAKDQTTGTPTGAVAVLMSTINQSWDPPMDAQDEMNDILIETYSNNIKRSFGGITMNGCMKMNDTYGTAGEEMTDTWTIFGDPSVMVRTKAADAMVVTHNSTLILGANSFTVSCSVNGALVTVWQSGQLLGSALSNGGNVTINFTNPINTVALATVTATAFNCTPYQGNVTVIPPTGPYVQNSLVTVDDPTGNNNTLADYGETIGLDVTLQNIGISQANNVTATLATLDPNVIINDNTEAYGNMATTASQLQANAYNLSIAADVPDQYSIPFTLTITDANSNSWTNNLSIIVQAPVLQTGNITIDDATGNTNGAMDPGETVNVLIPTDNIGHSISPTATGFLTTTSSLLTINNNSAPLGTIIVNGTVNAVFSITVSNSATLGTPIDLNYTATAGAYSANRLYQEVIGVVIETFETNTLTQYPWALSGDLPWFTTTDNALDGIYCSKSGAITDLQTSIMEMSIDVLANDSISFWYAVSSEAGYDFLRFYIDNVQVGEWTGAVNWMYNAFPVTTGTHVFKWVYSKDNVYSDGLDCAWIDNVQFPPFDANSLGIIESNALTQLSILPNPARDEVALTWYADQPGHTQIQIYDATGRIVVEQQQSTTVTGQQRIAINLTQLDAGIYFVYLNQNGKRGVVKLVRE